jgi:hypothetical protein
MAARVSKCEIIPSELFIIRRRKYGSKGVSYLCSNKTWRGSADFYSFFPEVLKDAKSAEKLRYALARSDAIHTYSIRIEFRTWWIKRTD